MPNKEIQTIRRELSNSVRKHFFEKHPNCFYCNHPAIIIHHIIPVSMGGDNRDSNLLAVCEQCHKAIHGTVAFKNLQKKGYSSSHLQVGRPKLVKPSNFDEVFNKWINKEITAKEAQKQLNISNASFYRWVKQWGNVEYTQGEWKVIKQ